MKERIVSYFSGIQPLSQEEEEAIANSAVIKKYEKGAFLVREGQYSDDTFFVFQGLIRQYTITDGEERTTAFFTENQWVISLNTIDVPSRYFWVCEEDATLMIGNDNMAQKIFIKFPRLEAIARKIVENAFIEYQQSMNIYLSDTPEQRYIRILETRPDLIQRIPQYQLASYIGVKPESLSRIRKRISGKLARI